MDCYTVLDCWPYLPIVYENLSQHCGLEWAEIESVAFQGLGCDITTNACTLLDKAQHIAPVCQVQNTWNYKHSINSLVLEVIFISKIRVRKIKRRCRSHLKSRCDYLLNHNSNKYTTKYVDLCHHPSQCCQRLCCCPDSNSNINTNFHYFTSISHDTIMLGAHSLPVNNGRPWTFPSTCLS